MQAVDKQLTDWAAGRLFAVVNHKLVAMPSIIDRQAAIINSTFLF